MNKKLGLGLSIAMISALLAACGGNNDNAESPAATSTESSAPETESERAPE